MPASMNDSMEPAPTEIQDVERGTQSNEAEAIRFPPPPRDTGGNVVVLSFRALQLERNKHLKDDLIRHDTGREALLKEYYAHLLEGVSGTRTTKETDELLGRYAEALRNYEILSTNTLSSVPDGYHFVGSAEASNYGRALGIEEASKRDLFLRFKFRVWKAARKLIGPFSRSTADSDRSEVLQEIRGLGFRELDRQGREARERHEAKILRLTMALFGGIALIAPMLIMSLHQSLNTSLITTSIATLLFGIIIGFGASDSSGKDVLGATAAYAAVLVVFVVTSLTVTPESSASNA